MSGIPHDHYEPTSNAEKWIDKRLPIVGLLYDTIKIPHAQEPELDVDLGHCPDDLPCVADRHRHCAGHALHPRRRSGLCQWSSISCAT